MADPGDGVDPADVMSILVATDSHLGYEERDPVRGMDSFAAFEEVLLLAKENKADFVLLGESLRTLCCDHHCLLCVPCLLLCVRCIGCVKDSA